MHVSFEEILQFCFGEASNCVRRKVEQAIINDESTAEILGGINKIKRQLGTKTAVEEYFQKTIEESQKVIFG